MNLGMVVRDARRLHGWTQEELGKRSGLSRQAIILLEKNRGRVSTLAAVEQHLRLRFSGICDGANWGERVRASRLSRGKLISGTAKIASIATNTLRAIEGGGGSVSSLSRVLASLVPDAQPKPSTTRWGRLANINIKGVRARHHKAETFRTPRCAFTPLLDYCPDWFVGRGCDPSAGDGRMLSEIVARGNQGPHWANDIRKEEQALMCGALPASSKVTIADYLVFANAPDADFLITNPPFTRAIDFVRKAQTHVRGAICILQSVAWQGTIKRSKELKDLGLAYVLNLPRRPKWEVDVGVASSNIWDFAWFVFLPSHNGLPQMDWLMDGHTLGSRRAVALRPSVG